MKAFHIRLNPSHDIAYTTIILGKYEDNDYGQVEYRFDGPNCLRLMALALYRDKRIKLRTPIELGPRGQPAVVGFTTRDLLMRDSKDILPDEATA